MKLKDGWYAKDSNQDVYWCKEMPVKQNNCWGAVELSRLSACIQIDGPWEDSLHRVEDGKITKVQIYSKDQKVLVSDDGEQCGVRIWWRRHYSHYKAGKHFVFANGKTSWSEEGTSTFKYIKPAEEEQNRTEYAFGDRRDVEEAMLDERERKVQQRIREAIDAERQRIVHNLTGDKL